MTVASHDATTGQRERRVGAGEQEGGGCGAAPFNRADGRLSPRFGPDLPICGGRPYPMGGGAYPIR
jgi:hypothetical protein